MDDDAQSGVCFTAKVLRIEPNFPLDDSQAKFSYGAGLETGCGVREALGSARVTGKWCGRSLRKLSA